MDFEAASRLMGYFLRKGKGVGESSALALYAIMQLINYGAGKNFVVILADGAEKYQAKPKAEPQLRAEVGLEEARSDPSAFEVVIWTHCLFTPKDIAGCGEVLGGKGIEGAEPEGRDSRAGDQERRCPGPSLEERRLKRSTMNSADMPRQKHGSRTPSVFHRRRNHSNLVRNNYWLKPGLFRQS